MIKTKLFWLGLMTIIALTLFPGCNCGCTPEEEGGYQPPPPPTDEVRASAIKTPNNLAEGETTTFTINITNDSTKDLEIKEITIEWWWQKPGGDNQFQETEKINPASEGWQTSQVMIGKTVTIYKKQEQVSGIGDWHGAVSVMTSDDIIYTDVDLTIRTK